MAWTSQSLMSVRATLNRQERLESRAARRIQDFLRNALQCDKRRARRKAMPLPLRRGNPP